MRRGSLRRWLISTVVLLALVVGAVVGYDQLVADSKPPSVSLPSTPHFSLDRLGGDGTIAFPSARYSHRPVVLVFFASWCTACQPELPVVARVARSLASSGSPVLFLGVDGNDAPSSGLAFARRSGVDFPAVVDRQETVAYQLGLPGLPDTVFVDRRGQVVHVVEGVITATALRHWAGVVAAST